MTEQQPYSVAADYDGFQLRLYPEHLVAEVEVRNTFEDAANRAFRSLAGYIRGGNAAGTRIAMTAPVLQDGTATENRYRVSFVLPASVSERSAPAPADPQVQVRAVPEGYAAALRFSGRWSQQIFEERARRLAAAVAAAGLTPVAPPRFARYDPPFKPWFLRRNEVLVSVRDPETANPAAGGPAAP